MADTPPPAPVETHPNADPVPAPLWTGAGLCCEAQGDGVPCAGPAGECETCGRKLPPPTSTADA